MHCSSHWIQQCILHTKERKIDMVIITAKKEKTHWVSHTNALKRLYQYMYSLSLIITKYSHCYCINNFATLIHLTNTECFFFNNNKRTVHKRLVVTILLFGVNTVPLDYLAFYLAKLIRTRVHICLVFEERWKLHLIKFSPLKSISCTKPALPWYVLAWLCRSGYSSSSLPLTTGSSCLRQKISTSPG